jgi:hypothetical protein
MPGGFDGGCCLGEPVEVALDIGAGASVQRQESKNVRYGNNGEGEQCS